MANQAFISDFEADFEQAFLEFEKQQQVVEGEIVRGTVLSVNKDFEIGRAHV